MKDMTFRKKLEYIWDYYRWHILAAVVGLAVITGIALEWKGRNVPDYQIAVVTQTEISAEDAVFLEEAFRTAAEKLDPQKTNVVISTFWYDPISEDAESREYMDILNGVTLNAELTSGNCLIYITDEFSYRMILGQGEDLLLSPDDSDLMYLSQLLSDLPDSLEGLYISLRSVDTLFLEDADSAQERLALHTRLLETLE